MGRALNASDFDPVHTIGQHTRTKHGRWPCDERVTQPFDVANEDQLGQVAPIPMGRFPVNFWHPLFRVARSTFDTLPSS